MTSIASDVSNSYQASTEKRWLPDESDLTWRVLATLNAFRLLLAIVLVALFFASDEPRLFGERYPALFSATAAGYLVFAALSGFAIRQRWVGAALQVVVQTAIDIAAIVTLMHASGGIDSGLGGLLIVFVGASSITMPLWSPAFFAALATLAILAEQFLSQVGGATSSGDYPAAGLLGAIIFAITLAARPLTRRLHESEALARQQGVDLANLAELNEYVVQHLRESIVVMDSDDRVRLINESAAHHLGATLEANGQILSELSPALYSYLQAWRNSSESTPPEFSLFAADQSTRITAHVAPLDKSDASRGPVLIFLEDASLMGERVQQSKLASLGRLSASIAHEIRNPVGAMSHAGQLLAESPALGPEEQRLTEIIQTHAERVSLIIDNVLQLSRRETSRPQRLILGPWLAEFVAEFTKTLELLEGQISVQRGGDDVEVRMDTSHLRQVLWNLCDNAVKYASETGGISVELYAGRLQPSKRPFLEVLDRGHGVEPDTADKIFEPFYTARRGGTGLGLYISRELCELNRATLVHEARPGGGSVFRIIFDDPNRWDPLEHK